MAKDRNQPFIIQPGGLSTDTSLVAQPEGTTRFVLNGVNETPEGDLGFISIEESNRASYNLPEGFIPLGYLYVGNEEKLLFCLTISIILMLQIKLKCGVNILLLQCFLAFQ